MAESFFAALKNELVYRTSFPTPEHARRAVAEYIEVFSNWQRIHSSLGGLQVMSAMMDADVEAVCGAKGRHDPARTGVRHGREKGSVTLGGRRVAVARPRARAADGSGELPVPTYELFNRTEVLGRMAIGTDAGGPVDPPLPGRPGTGRRQDRAGGAVGRRARFSDRGRSAVPSRSRAGRSVSSVVCGAVVTCWRATAWSPGWRLRRRAGGRR